MKMKLILVIAFSSLINSCFGLSTTPVPRGVCPSSALVSYCECDNNVITCDGLKPYNLSEIFSAMSKTLTKEQNHFGRFELKNHGISELEDNVFHGIRFTNLVITDATNLTKISVNAFNGTYDEIEEINFRGKNQLGKNGQIKELFESLSSLPNLKRLEINTQSIDNIPENAFKNKQNSLYHLNFDFWFNETTSGSIKTIGNKAFYFLNNLTELSFGRNSIDFVPKNAFDFELASNETLLIYLHENNLNDTSFENGLFANTKRPVYIYLRNNKITYLDEKIFAILLANDNKSWINVDSKKMVCDCRMFWLMKNKKDYYKRVINVGCDNGMDFWELTLKDFENC